MFYSWDISNVRFHPMYSYTGILSIKFSQDIATHQSICISGTSVTKRD